MPRSVKVASFSQFKSELQTAVGQNTPGYITPPEGAALVRSAKRVMDSASPEDASRTRRTIQELVDAYRDRDAEVFLTASAYHAFQRFLADNPGSPSPAPRRPDPIPVVPEGPTVPSGRSLELDAELRNALGGDTPNMITMPEGQRLVTLVKEIIEGGARGRVSEADAERARHSISQLLKRHQAGDSGLMIPRLIVAQLQQILLRSSPNLRDLNSALVPYGSEVLNVGVPAFLRGETLRALEVFPSFGSAMAGNGSGIHLGDGFTLTNWHVYGHIVDGSPVRTRFQGTKALGNGWTLRLLPDPGTFSLDKKQLSLEEQGASHDFALLHDSQRTGEARLPGRIRATASLAPGEQIWVVGDQTDGKLRVTTGRFDSLVGDNARIRGIALEGGFSGSPALDRDGNLVGLIFYKDRADGVMISTESISKFLDEARRTDPSIPPFTPERI